MLLFRVGWWRFQAALFGGIARRLEAFHDRWHPEAVTAYRCLMCEDRLAWRDTAAIEANPALLRSILDRGSDDEYLDLPRPL